MKKTLMSLLLISCSFFTQAQKQDSVDIMIGQMIMIGIGDFNTLNKNHPIFASLEKGYAGGIIFFEKNISFESPSKNLKEIISFAQKKSPVPLFVSIDEEGGRVNRLKTKYGFPKTVTAQYLGNLDNLDSTRFYAYQTAFTLSGLGFNLNYTPDLDVNVNPINPIIGKIGRSYSEDPVTVARHAGEVVKIHDNLKVATALKHFPGHGSSREDTHLGIADVSETWLLEELYPYKSLMDSGLVRMIMTAHIVNHVLDPDKLPATLSERVVTGLLRGFLQYDGVVISDDMQMGAIRKEYGLEESITKCINAGVDVVMFANNVPDSDLVSAEKIHAIIKGKVQNGEIPLSRIMESYERIMILKKELGLCRVD